MVKRSDRVRQQQEVKRDHSKKADGSTAGRDWLGTAILGNEKGTWEVVTPYKRNLGYGGDYLDPRGNHGQAGWQLRFIGKSAIARPQDLIDRLVDRHGYTPEQAEEYRETKPGDTEFGPEVGPIMAGENTIRLFQAAGIIKPCNIVQSTGPVATKSGPVSEK